jgi:LacI family gluconate utilization system Gnt-I transcriptional repressor
VVGFDHAQIGAAVAEYFIGKGHDRFAVFAADDARALARRRGFAEAAARAGKLIRDAVLPAPSTIQAGRQALRAMLPELDRRTALFCSSDLLAFGAIVEARRHGIAGPERLAVCGFGDFEIAAESDLPFTTVTVEAGLIGREAARLLLDQLSGSRGPQHISVPFRIVPRAST